MRADQPYAGDERSLLTQWLGFQRETLAMKCDGLTAEQLASQAVPPSTLSLARLLRHLADMERMDAQILAGEAPSSLYEADSEGEGGDGEDGEGEPEGGMYDWSLYDTADDAVAVWRDQCRRLDEVVARAGSLDDRAPGDFAVLTVRSIVLALTMEYARHNGHADLLRQALDGAVGY